MVVGFPAMALVVDLAGHGWLLVVPSLPKSQSTLVAGVPSSNIAERERERDLVVDDCGDGL